jgi:hypothetical protein
VSQDFNYDPNGYTADRIDRMLRAELLSSDIAMLSLVATVDRITLANSVRALLKERDQRSPHYLLAFALREQFDKRVNADFEPRYEAERLAARKEAA